MVNVGIIGLGFMGVTHFKALCAVEGARVAAVCTRDQQKLRGDWTSVKGNFGEGGGVQDLSGIALYENWRDLLADESIDLVSVCLPSHLHRPVSIAALEAGKHVLVEKPIALTLADADAMLEASAKAGKLLMVGQVLRFFPAFAEACALVHSGEYGALLGAHFKRIIARPSWSKDDHFDDVSKSGGAALDLHIHDTDFVHYLAGVPQSVRATGVVGPDGAVQYIQTQYLYKEDNFCISAQSGALSMPALGFEHGFDIYLEKATLQYNNLFTGNDIWLYPAAGEKQTLTPRRPEAFVAQLQHAVECVNAGKDSALISGSSARMALKVCLNELEAVISGSEVKVIL